jgi:hypothetical protein
MRFASMAKLGMRAWIDSITRHPYPISKTPAHGLLVASDSFITTIDAQALRLAQ